MDVREMRVREKMTRKVYIMDSSDSLDEAFRMMQTHKFRHLPILGQGELVGILSEKDVLLASTRDQGGSIKVPHDSIEKHMSPTPVTIRDDATLRDVAEAMLENHVGCLPVMNSFGSLVGMLTTTDIVEALLDDQWQSAKYMPFNFELYRNSIDGLERMHEAGAI